MPKLTSDELQTNKIKGTSFTYSAAKIEELGATEYTLVTIVVDQSGSVNEFKDELEKCLSEIVKACKYSPRADNLMIRLIRFSSDYDEMHGFKELSNINPDDYIGCLNINGMTALFDSSYNAIMASNDYGKSLYENDYEVNGIVFVLTDGCDNTSTYSSKEVSKALKDAMKKENLESLVSILIGVGVDDPDVVDELDTFNKEAGFTQYEVIKNANAKTLAKLAEFVSKSISSQSQSLGSGGASSQLPSLNI